MKSFSDLEEALENIDLHLGRFVEKYPEANFIIMSDHGSVRTKGAFMIMNWLEDSGFLKFKRTGKRLRFANVVLAETLSRRLNRRGLSEKVVRRLLSYGCVLLPEKLWRSIVLKIDKAHSLQVYCPPELVDLKRSKISFCSAALFGVYVNPRLTGWEYENTCAELVKELRELTANGEKNPVFAFVERSGQINDGPFAADGPDIIAWGNHEFHTIANCRIANSVSRGVPYCVIPDNGYYGAHTESGIYVFSGEPFKSTGISKDLHITDIPAMILALYGIPAPESFDGVAPLPFLKEAPAVETPSLKATEESQEIVSESLSAEEEAEVKERLKSLGYM
ncbi:MAG: hypothetical protein Kow0099_26700 [Candidatus Abyssubacteria bacterium]